MIPIDGSSKDPFYRYRMPPVQVMHDASKTFITNLDQVSKYLHRNPVHILKFLSFSLGCNCIKNDRFALNGNFNAERIQSAIYDFIDLFVLCNECNNPETKFVYGNILKRVCNSCGAEFVQENHKLNMLILKDKDKHINEDTKYEQGNKSKTISDLLKEDKDKSDEIYEFYVQEGLELDGLFSDYVKAKDFKQLSKVLKKYEIEEILPKVLAMVEAFKKEERIGSYLKALKSVGFASESIEDFFLNPKDGKRKLSPLLKKNVEFFLENEDL